MLDKPHVKSCAEDPNRTEASPYTSNFILEVEQ